jgi:hypothetical protein
MTKSPPYIIFKLRVYLTKIAFFSKNLTDFWISLNLSSSLNDPYASEASSPFPQNHYLNMEQFLKFPCFTKSNESVIQYYTAPQISSKLIFKRGRCRVCLSRTGSVYHWAGAGVGDMSSGVWE